MQASIIIAVHLLATDCIVATNVITMPYKVVYLDSKLVTATMHGCNYSAFHRCVGDTSVYACNASNVSTRSHNSDLAPLSQILFREMRLGI